MSRPKINSLPELVATITNYGTFATGVTIDKHVDLTHISADMQPIVEMIKFADGPGGRLNSASEDAQDHAARGAHAFLLRGIKKRKSVLSSVSRIQLKKPVTG